MIPGLVVVLCFEDKEWWNRPPHRVDASNQRHPLTIARLNSKWLEASLRGCYYFDRPSNAYLEASLIKIIDVFVQNPILSLNVAYKIKPGPNNS